jgi:molecular chaperone GrpE
MTGEEQTSATSEKDNETAANEAATEEPGEDLSGKAVQDLRDQLLRALAEQENMRRRAQREREAAVRFAAADLVRDLLPSVDNLRRAISSVPDEAAVADESLRALLLGIEGTERALLDALSRRGVVQILPVLGEPFDSNRHQAIFQVADSDCPANTVAEIVLPGYAYHERLLRPALVGVAQVAAAQTAPPQAAPDATRESEKPADDDSGRGEAQRKD